MCNIGVKSLIAILFLIIFLTPVISHASLVNVSSTQETGSLTQGLVGHWTFDAKDLVSNVADKSGNGNDGKMISFGATSTAVTAGKLGQGLKFDGVNDNILVSTTLIISSNNWTLSGWVNLKTISGTQTIFMHGDHYGGGVSGMWFSLVTGAPKITVAVGTDSSENILATNAINKNQWTHITAVKNGVGIYLYVNGAEVKNGTLSSATMDYSTSGSTFFGMGKDGNNSSYFSGSLDDIRAYSRSLSAAEVKQLYNLGSANKVNVSSAVVDDGNTLQSGLVGHWTFDAKDMVSNVADKSGSNNTGYLTGFGATSTAVTTGKLGQGLKFDGVNDYVITSQTPSLTNSTMSGWVKTGIKGIENHLFEYSPVQTYLSAAGTITFKNKAGGVNVNAGIITKNVWTHLVFVCNSTGHFIYKNGVLASSANDTNICDPISGVLNIGRYFGTGFTFQGSLDDIRIYSRALSASEIKQLYNQGAASKVNVSSAVADDGNTLQSGLVGHWSFDAKDMVSNVADRSESGNTGKLIGFGATSTAVTAGKIGQGLKFDGVDDYVNIGDANNLSLSSSGFTISSWVYLKKLPPALTASRMWIITKGATSNYEWGVSVNDFDTTCLGKFVGVFWSLNGIFNQGKCSSTSPVANRWYHIVFTMANNSSATVPLVYVNGVLETGTTRTSTPNPTYGNGTAPVQIGRRNDVAQLTLNGITDDVRVYSRALSASEVKQLYNMGR